MEKIILLLLAISITYAAPNPYRHYQFIRRGQPGLRVIGLNERLEEQPSSGYYYPKPENGLPDPGQSDAETTTLETVTNDYEETTTLAEFEDTSEPSAQLKEAPSTTIFPETETIKTKDKIAEELEDLLKEGGKIIEKPHPEKVIESTTIYDDVEIFTTTEVPENDDEKSTLPLEEHGKPSKLVSQIRRTVQFFGVPNERVLVTGSSDPEVSSAQTVIPLDKPKSDENEGKDTEKDNEIEDFETTTLLISTEEPEPRENSITSNPESELINVGNKNVPPNVNYNTVYFVVPTDPFYQQFVYLTNPSGYQQVLQPVYLQPVASTSTQSIQQPTSFSSQVTLHNW